jgi:hypothetical protein
MVPAEGFEPPTYGLQNRCTTTVLSRQINKLRHAAGSGAHSTAAGSYNDSDAVGARCADEHRRAGKLPNAAGFPTLFGL